MTYSYRGSGVAGASVDRNPGSADRIPPDSRPEGWRLRLTALVWTIGWEAGRRLPEALVYGIADVAARLLHRLSGGARLRVARNMRRVVPTQQVDQIGRAHV